MKDIMGLIICILFLNVISAGKSSWLSWARRVELEGNDQLIRSVAWLFQARKVCMEITRGIQT